MIPKPWWVYLLRCRDGTLYTGIALDPHERLRRHNAGRGSKYVSGRRPANLVDIAGPYSRTLAARLEAWIRHHAPIDKLLAIQQLSAGRIDVNNPKIIRQVVQDEGSDPVLPQQ